MPYICRAKTRGGKQPGARTQPATPMKADVSERSIGYATNWTHDMAGLFYILFFWLIGNILSRLTGSIVSGNIIGMVLLFASLCLRWVKAETVRPAARFLLAGMALFFVPYGVGLMGSYRGILDNLWGGVVSGGGSAGGGVARGGGGLWRPEWGASEQDRAAYIQRERRTSASLWQYRGDLPMFDASFSSNFRQVRHPGSNYFSNSQFSDSSIMP